MRLEGFGLQTLGHLRLLEGVVFLHVKLLGCWAGELTVGLLSCWAVAGLLLCCFVVGLLGFASWTGLRLAHRRPAKSLLSRARCLHFRPLEDIYVQ